MMDDEIRILLEKAFEKETFSYKINEFKVFSILFPNDYKEFLGLFNGGDTAYGINIKGQFIEVPFVGMEDNEVKIIGNNFPEFIKYLCK